MIPKPPTSRTDAQCFLLNSLGITSANHRGIRIASFDISKVNCGSNIPETSTELAKILGNNVKNGTAYIAPLDKAMERLIAYHCAPEPRAKPRDLLEQSRDKSEPIPLQSKRQA